MGRYAGADWIEQAAKTTLSDFGRQVADLLGDLFFGIYHIRKDALNTDFSDPRMVEISLRSNGKFATYDFNLLTRLVFLCHDRAVRCEIDSCNMQKIKLIFHPRKREGGASERHPTIEQAVADFRNIYSD